MKFAWIDLRPVPAALRQAVVEAAVHARLQGVLDEDRATLASLPPTVRKIRIASSVEEASSDATDIDATDATDATDITAVPVATEDGLNQLRLVNRTGDQRLAAYVDVIDAPSLQLACVAATALAHTIVKFRDPTKIPLEIVIAAANSSDGQLVCEVESLEEAEIVLGVLEKGSEGVLMAPRDVNEVFGLDKLLRTQTPELALSKLTVNSIEHNGLGDRVCVDTCSHFDQDEGILVGSYAHGFILCASETHPLPYMPTRPFRVNAGALHSYVLGIDNHTNYLSELHSGSSVLAVTASGRTRRITVGRVKLESRPLLTIKATAENGSSVGLTVQDDWHVRVLGPGSSILNVTELKPGDQVLGYLATDQRHVGWPVGEFCIEK